MGRRSPRLVALLAAAVGTTVVGSACSSIDELLELEARIERAGYVVNSVFHEDFGTGRNEVQVDAEPGRGLDAPEGQDEIAGIVWETYPRRFSTVAVRLDGDQIIYSRGDLQERFGARPERLDEREFSDDVSGTLRTFAIVALVAIVAVIAGTVAIVIILRRRRRNQQPPPFRGMRPPPPPGPPPGWAPPPPSQPPPPPAR